MKAHFSIHKTECFKGLILGLMTMLMTVVIREMSMPQSHVKLTSLMRHPLDTEQLKSALTRYFLDHSDTTRVVDVGVSLQTLEDEGYLTSGASVDAYPVPMRFHQSILSPTKQPSGEIWVEAFLPSGECLVVLDDGSVQDVKHLNRF